MFVGSQIQILIKFTAPQLKISINFATFCRVCRLSQHKPTSAFHRRAATVAPQSGSAPQKCPSPAKFTTSSLFTDGRYTCGFCICSPLPLKSPAVPGLSFDMCSVGAATGA